MIKRKKGFTLIELLVVISIIGLLSSVVLASLSGTRKKARDSVRKSDLKQLQLALNLYLSNHDGKFPTEQLIYDTSRGCSSNVLTCNPYYSLGVNDGGNGWGNVSEAGVVVSEGLIPALPKDPINSTTYMYKIEFNNNNNYCLGAQLESTGAIFYVNGGEPPFQNPFDWGVNCSN